MEGISRGYFAENSTQRITSKLGNAALDLSNQVLSMTK